MNLCNGNCEFCRSAKEIRIRVFGDTEGLSSVPGSGKTFLCGSYCLRFTDAEDFDVALDVIDARTLDRSLFQTTKLIDKNLRIAGAIIRYDELLSTGHSLDYDTLGDLFGCRFAPADFSSDESLGRIFSMLIDAYEGKDGAYRHRHITYGQDIDDAISDICREIDSAEGIDADIHDRYLSIGLLGGEMYDFVKPSPHAGKILDKAAIWAERLEKGYKKTVFELVHEARCGFVAGALQETLRHGGDDSDHTLIQKIDRILTNRWLGFPILAAVLFLVFVLTFSLGEKPQAWIESGIGLLASWIKSAMEPGWLTSLLADGIVRGVGAVIAFLPNIIILFFFLSVLEDTGYMSRAAFLMDKIMHKVGLHGRSFVPMIIGFGCNVPAIMAAKSIDDPKDRTLTMLMIPFMSCSARLPVYMLFVSAFFTEYKALVMIGIYLTGVLLSILFAMVMKRTRFFSKPEDDYVSELPAFRKPTLRNMGRHIWERVEDYLQKITTVILWASIIIWALGYFPNGQSLGDSYAVAQESVAAPDHGDSYLESIGKFVAPVMEPLGFDWKMSVCILTGLPAKEAIVSTMGILYQADSEGSLADKLSSRDDFSPAAALAFMVFVLLYFPCLATVSALRKETGLKWAAFTVIHSLLLAWVTAFVVFHLFSILL